MFSMTGCGKSSVNEDGWEVTCEVKSVNHRFLDVSMRLPRNLSFLEDPVRRKISSCIRRGHIEVFIAVKKSTTADDVVIDEQLLERYVLASQKLSSLLPNSPLPTVAEIMQLPDVVRVEETEIDEETVLPLTISAMQIALDKLCIMRRSEGDNLRNDILLHLGVCDDIRGKIAEKAPDVVDEYRKGLTQRLESWKIEHVDESRIAQEVALIADKCAIDEELSRLSSHISQMKKYADNAGEVGKKMDFLVQEMNREANTIGSKASNAEIAQMVVDLKSEIEKMREQIQNVE